MLQFMLSEFKLKNKLQSIWLSVRGDQINPFNGANIAGYGFLKQNGDNTFSLVKSAVEQVFLVHRTLFW